MCGSLLPRVVFSGLGGFPLDKNHAQNIFSRENKSQITKIGPQKNGFPRPKSLCGAEISKNAKVSKNRSSKLQIIEKTSGPRTTRFLDPGATSARNSGGEKGDQKKDRPKLAYHYFSREKCRYARFRLEKNSTRIVRTTIFVVFGRA